MKVLFSTNFRPKTRKIVRAVFEQMAKTPQKWPFLTQNANFPDFENRAVLPFLNIAPLTPCRKSKKSLEPFLRSHQTDYGRTNNTTCNTQLTLRTIITAVILWDLHRSNNTTLAGEYSVPLCIPLYDDPPILPPPDQHEQENKQTDGQT